MIPDQPTEENMKPVLDLMVPTMSYSTKGTGHHHKIDTFQWADEILASINGHTPQGRITTHDIPGLRISVTCIIHDSTVYRVDP